MDFTGSQVCQQMLGTLQEKIRRQCVSQLGEVTNQEFRQQLRRVQRLASARTEQPTVAVAIVATEKKQNKGLSKIYMVHHSDESLT